MTKARSHFAAGLRPLVDLIYPPRCPLCGEGVVEQSGLCADCFGELEFPGDPSCALCRRPLDTAKAAKDEICPACRADPPAHRGIHAATLYNDASRRLLLSFKHGGKIALAGLMARLIAVRLPDPAPDESAPPLLVPVPLHRWRIWQRGYNQAAMLAHELARQGRGELVVDALVRRKATRSLGGLGREAREATLAGAIAVDRAKASRIEGRSVILVDDVLTSGATSNACVAALIEAGAKDVVIACFARVVDGRDRDVKPGGGTREPNTRDKQSAPGRTGVENTGPRTTATQNTGL